MNNLGAAYHASGRTEDAINLLVECVRLRKVRPGPDHDDTIRSMNNLGQIHRSRGENDHALVLFQDVYQARNADSAPSTPTRSRVSGS